MTLRVTADMANHQSVELGTVLQHYPKICRLMGVSLVDKFNSDSKLLVKTSDHACYESRAAKNDDATCLRPSENSSQMLSRYEFSFRTYQPAISLVPIILDLALRHIPRVRIKGDQTAARVSNDLLRKYPRFNFIVQEMAKETRRFTDSRHSPMSTL